MEWAILGGDNEKGTLLSTCYIVSLFEGAAICISKSAVACQGSLCLKYTKSQLGNIWRD